MVVTVSLSGDIVAVLCSIVLCSVVLWCAGFSFIDQVDKQKLFTNLHIFQMNKAINIVKTNVCLLAFVFYNLFPARATFYLGGNVFTFYVVMSYLKLSPMVQTIFIKLLCNFCFIFTV